MVETRQKLRNWRICRSTWICRPQNWSWRKRAILPLGGASRTWPTAPSARTPSRSRLWSAPPSLHRMVTCSFGTLVSLHPFMSVGNVSSESFPKKWRSRVAPKMEGTPPPPEINYYYYLVSGSSALSAGWWGHVCRGRSPLWMLLVFWFPAGISFRENGFKIWFGATASDSPNFIP